MIRQPSKPDKMYTVEVTLDNGNCICQDPCVYAQTPAEAVVFALRKQGFAISRKNVAKYVDNGHKGTIARVCLLAGARESETYFDIWIG